MGVSFLHIGLTVTDIGKTSDFYTKYLSFTKGRSRVFDEKFFSALPDLFRQPEGVYSDMQTLISPDGVELELFRFSNVENAGAAEFQKTGYSHIALRVDDVPALYEAMKADGVEFFMPPLKNGDTGGHWIYLKDPDGNMLELWD